MSVPGTEHNTILPPSMHSIFMIGYNLYNIKCTRKKNFVLENLRQKPLHFSVNLGLYLTKSFILSPGFNFLFVKSPLINFNMFQETISHIQHLLPLSVYFSGSLTHKLFRLRDKIFLFIVFLAGGISRQKQSFFIIIQTIVSLLLLQYF